MVLSLPLLLLSAAAIARASPTPLSGLTLRALAVPGTSPVCTLDGLDKFLVLPSNQMDVQPPAAESQLVQILMGRGVQNYTCGPDSVYVKNQAVADLYDASCFLHLPSALSFLPSFFLSFVGFPQPFQSGAFAPKGHHFFLPNADGTSSPHFELKEALGDKDAFVTLKLKGKTPSPTDPKKTIAWLELTAIDGGLATSAYRVDTAGGQPPSSCDPRDTSIITIPYAALYWFFKG